MDRVLWIRDLTFSGKNPFEFLDFLYVVGDPPMNCLLQGLDAIFENLAS